MLLIGLTGGIGSGKSLVASHLASLGAIIVDADQMARDVVRPGMPAYNDIIDAFGTDVLTIEGEINRKALGAVVFADEEKLHLLSSITHPRIYEAQAQRLQEILQDDPDALVVLEVALLLEAGLHRNVEYLLITYCERDQQLQRVMERDGLDRESAELRLAAQWPLIEKVPFADFIIDTTGSIEWTLRQVEALYPQLEGLAAYEDEDEDLDDGDHGSFDRDDDEEED